MNTKLLGFVFIIFLFSCEKNENSDEINYPPEISFEVSKFIPTENPVLNIELMPTGYYYSGFYENRIHFSTWGGDTSSFKTNTEVRALAFDQRFQRLYFGTSDSGIGLFDGEKAKYFNTENSIFLRDGAKTMDVDNEGNLWVSSSYKGEGGLYKFDGKNFTHFSTSNSPLTSDLIYGICCDNSGIYISGYGVNGKTVFRIVKDESNEYDWQELISDNNYFRGIELDLNGTIYIIYRIPSRDIIKLTKDGIQKIITPESPGEEGIYTHLKTDKRGYLWTNKFGGLRGQLSVYDGKTWYQPSIDIPHGGLSMFEVDGENCIWLATSKGIYILNQ